MPKSQPKEETHKKRLEWLEERKGKKMDKRAVAKLLIKMVKRQMEINE